jgi:hypothetical protein
MSETKDELVHDSIGAHRAADQLECRVIGVAINEVIEIEMTQASSPNASR